MTGPGSFSPAADRKSQAAPPVMTTARIKRAAHLNRRIEYPVCSSWHPTGGTEAGNLD